MNRTVYACKVDGHCHLNKAHRDKCNVNYYKSQLNSDKPKHDALSQSGITKANTNRQSKK